MKTRFTTKEESEKNRKWYVVDVADQVVGKAATKIASLLRGKNNPCFTPHNDNGDFVVVLNADKVKFTGDKLAKKIYRYHTGYVAGVKEETAGSMLERKPEEIIRLAVQGMLPKNTQGRNQMTKLKIYKGTEHPHSAQNPEQVTV